MDPQILPFKGFGNEEEENIVAKKAAKFILGALGLGAKKMTDKQYSYWRD